MLDEIETLPRRRAPTRRAEPGAVLTTVLEADLPASEQRLLDSALARFRGHALDAPPGRIRAGFDGPARAVRCATALADNFPALRAGVHTGECELHDGTAQRPGAGHRRRGRPGRRPGEILATSTVQDLVAGSGIFFADNSGTAGELRLFSVLR